MKTTLAIIAAILVMGTAATQAAERWPDRGEILIQVRDHRSDDWRDRGRDHGRHRNERRRDDVIPERGIIRMLSRQGFVSVEDIRLRRDRYIVEAVRPNGALVRLSIDAYDGDILSRDRIGWLGDRGSRHRGGAGGGRIEFDLGGAPLGLYRR